MIDDLRAETGRRMDASVASVQREFGSVRTGRASIALLDGVSVDAYGSDMPINQVATLASPDSAMLTVKPFDISLLGAIERAILKADLGINPANDGKLIRLPIPPLNEERRLQLSKKVSELVENGKTAVRNIRRDANEQVKKLEKDSELSQDDARRGLEEIQQLTDTRVAQLDKLGEAKIKEIMTV